MQSCNILHTIMVDDTLRGVTSAIIGEGVNIHILSSAQQISFVSATDYKRNPLDKTERMNIYPLPNYRASYASGYTSIF
jgi:hypothetical protein